jgi:hypothetical protein
MQVVERKISIKPLKRWAVEMLSPGVPLRELLLSYPDNLEGEAFLHLIPTWLRLLDQSKDLH